MHASDVVTCLKYDARQVLKRTVMRLVGRPLPRPLPSRVPIRRIKNMIIAEGLGVSNGQPTWFYSAYARGDVDPLTNYAFEFIEQHVPRGAPILVTGCGTGITACHFADIGLEVDAFDLLPECIKVADRIRAMGGYTNLRFWADDGFNPTLKGEYDAITALHWVFSAWMGNYGNTPTDANKARDPAFRERALTDLLANYVPHLTSGGWFLIELIDAVTDYRIPSDHRLGDYSQQIYPVRQTPEQVERCATEVGLTVVDKKLCVGYGHHPRTLYVLTKR